MRTLILQQIAEAEATEFFFMLLLMWLTVLLALSVINNLRHRQFISELMADGSIKKVRRIK